MTITQRETDALNIIRNYIARHGYSPTLTELSTALGVKYGGWIANILDALERKGWITRERYKTRGIKIKEKL